MTKSNNKGVLKLVTKEGVLCIFIEMNYLKISNTFYSRLKYSISKSSVLQRAIEAKANSFTEFLCHQAYMYGIYKSSSPEVFL